MIPINVPAAMPNIIYIGISDNIRVFLLIIAKASIWPILWKTAPKILETIIENLSLFRQTVKIKKLNKKPETDIANLIILPNNIPIIVSLKKLIIIVCFTPKVLIPIMVMILLKPILMPKPPRLIGNKDSIYERMSIKERRMTPSDNLRFFNKFLFDIMVTLW